MLSKYHVDPPGTYGTVGSHDIKVSDFPENNKKDDPPAPPTEQVVTI